eukprot:15432214-Alexandrium_andersonii.AAC.1
MPPMAMKRGRAPQLLALCVLDREVVGAVDAACSTEEAGHHLGEPAGLLVLPTGGDAHGRALQVGSEAGGELHHVAPAAAIEGADDPALAVDGVRHLVLDDDARV